MFDMAPRSQLNLSALTEAPKQHECRSITVPTAMSCTADCFHDYDYLYCNQ